MDTHHDGKRAWFTSDPVFQAGYAKGLEDAARVVEDYPHMYHTLSEELAAAIRALKPLLAPWEGAALLGAAAGQSPASKAARDDEPPSQETVLKPQDPTGGP